ncbi:MAG: phenylalanine--tRNA ligase subunit alpha [Nitrospiria bacterium]
MDDAGLSILAEGLHPLEKQVLHLFSNKARLSETELLEQNPSLQSAQLSMALGWLQTKDVLALVDTHEDTFVSLTEVGRSYAKDKHPPLRMAEAIQAAGALSIKALQAREDMEAEEKSRAIGALRASGAVEVLSGGLLKICDPDKLSAFEAVQATIHRLEETQAPVSMQALSAQDRSVVEAHHRKRSKSKGIFRVDARVNRTYETTERFLPLYQRLASQKAHETLGALTPELLKDGAWREKQFRKYNIQLSPPRIGGGAKHPYKAFLDEVKEKFVSMGFSEMRGPLVESEFWDMDALYMPQFHPAREIHDVYFVKGRPVDRTIPPDLVARVAKTHASGGASGSRGWRYPFDTERTRRLILRSQGTSVSARTLGEGPKIPGKYFSIARCFRYDQVDATHAPDFFQVEGIVLGPEIHFRTLLGLLSLFAKEVARAEVVKFLPAYFPFTEPSVEMHVRHPQLGWMELGGAGLFRPEVTEPLGVDVPVIAWGLGLDRMAMIALGISDIRNLFASDLGMIREKQHIRSSLADEP